MAKLNTQDKTASEPLTQGYETFVNALNGLPNENEFRETLRDFVKRSAATARTRSADLHAGATKATGAIENVLVKSMNGVAEANRKIASAALQDVETACLTVDKLVGAGSFGEAYKTYFDYLVHQNEVGVARTKSAASYASAKASEALAAVRDSAAKLVPTWFQAA
jgi:hypothetical protein